MGLTNVCPRNHYRQDGEHFFHPQKLPSCPFLIDVGFNKKSPNDHYTRLHGGVWQVLTHGSLQNLVGFGGGAIVIGGRLSAQDPKLWDGSPRTHHE